MIDTAKLMGEPSDLAKATQVVLRAVEWSGYTTEQLLGPRRYAGLAWARHLAMTAIRRTTGLSLSQIGAIFDGRDHTSVIHAVRRVERLAKVNEALEERLRLLEGPGTPGE